MFVRGNRLLLSTSGPAYAGYRLCLMRGDEGASVRDIPAEVGHMPLEARAASVGLLPAGSLLIGGVVGKWLLHMLEVVLSASVLVGPSNGTGCVLWSCGGCNFLVGHHPVISQTDQDAYAYITFMVNTHTHRAAIPLRKRRSQVLNAASYKEP